MYPAVTIIIPVYNAESYLRRCLDSIVGQTMKDFEVICVNDGSKDSSSEILSEYACKDARIRILNQPNQGVSAARQAGLEMGGGNYVIHADPDDWVEPDWLKSLYDEALSSSADMVICDFERIYSTKKVYYCQKPTSLNSRDVLKDLLTNKLWGPCWNKLVRRELFYKYNVRFNPLMNLWEDLYVNGQLLMNDIKVAYVPKVLYHYDSCINPNSIVRYRNASHVRSGMILIDEFQERLAGEQYEECCFYLKSRIKSWVFNLPKSEYDIQSTYSEINQAYVAKYGDAGLLKEERYVAMAIEGHSKTAHILYAAVRRVRSLKKYLERIWKIWKK